jgi:hypothetical protein
MVDDAGALHVSGSRSGLAWKLARPGTASSVRPMRSALWTRPVRLTQEPAAVLGPGAQAGRIAPAGLAHRATADEFRA